MRFSRFMEIALYDPLAGYYSSGKATVGKEGDFFTSVSVGPVFGGLLAGQFLEMWAALGNPSDFRLIEQGANDGNLACDILMALKETPLANVPITIIEPHGILRDQQAAKLAGFDVCWVDSPANLSDFQGVHFSNELFDALPFDLVEAATEGWHEMLIHADTPRLALRPSQRACPWIDLPPRPKGFRAEIRRYQRDLLQSVSRHMNRGFLLAIDYGMSREELLAPHRSGGTLTCYSGHRRDNDPLENPGEKDITAHVDFTALAQDAVECGLHLEGYTDQHHFLVGAATRMLQALDGRPPTASTHKLLRSLRTLLHPEMMGTQFKSILFSKGKPLVQNLSGFQHARECELLKNWNQPSQNH